MSKSHDLVVSNSTRRVRIFEIFIQVLIILSLIAFSVETLPDLSERAKLWLGVFEFFTVMVFTVEYVLRVCIAKPTSRYVFSFFGFVDLAAILPYYIGLGIDLRSVRSFRLFRLLRLFKVARYNAALQRFHVALSIAKEEISLFLAATIILLYLGAVGIYHFECDAQPEEFGSVFHCLWWAVATLTTVGYGDVYPITTGGRVFTFFLLLVGLGVISVPAGLVASALAQARKMEDEAKE
ncbi:ion transporter [Thalassoglobus sp. JC818]|uniref:ion transporter n=1 Tax=Thalassoglobus sp. JC818 TaxID=3232136 RepID=UPI00345B418D